MRFILRFRLLLATLLFVGSFLLLYPLYQFILDDDGIGYATITRRWAQGDFFNAINGYWSPLHSWIALPFHLAGADLLNSFRISNVLIGVSIIWVMHLLTARIELKKSMKALILLMAVPILLYMSYYELAADILFCLLFLLYVNVCAAGDVFGRSRKIVLCAFIGFLAYLSKAYAFPLFIGHFVCWQYWLSKRSLLPGRKKQLVKNIVTGLLVFFILSLPWIIALHHKYDMWTFGYAGRLNLSWQVMPLPAAHVDFFNAPHLPDSPTLWEDPYYAQGRLYHSFSSMVTFGNQLKIILHNMIKLIATLNELSFLSIGLLMAMLLYVFKTRSGMLLLFLLSVILLPVGYLFIHIEQRFLWPAIFILLLSGFHLLSFFFRTYRFHYIAKNICWILFIASFLITPLNALQDMIGEGRTDYELAAHMRSDGRNLKLASNPEYYSVMRKAAFISGNQYYEIVQHQHSHEQLAYAAKEAGIEYFYFFYKDVSDLSNFQQSPVFRAAVKQRHIPSHKLLILKL